MRSIALTRASILCPITAFLGRVGAPVESLLASAGLPAWVLGDPEGLIPTSSAVRLLNLAARTEGIENFGLQVGERAEIEALGVFGRLICGTATLGQALEVAVHNCPTFTSDGRMWLAMHEDDVELCQAFGKPFDGWQQASHYALMLMLAMIRLGAGPTWRPAEVRLQSDESVALRDAEFLSAARLAFGQPATSIKIPRGLLDRPLERRGHGLRNADDDIDAWKASAPAGDFVASITQLIETLSREGYPAIHVTARILGTSVRSLQRRLATVGLTHESLVGHVRFTTAAVLLGETQSKVLDIALDLGYSDHAHFTRAFRRWAGCSPQEFRNNLRQCQRDGFHGLSG